MVVSYFESPVGNLILSFKDKMLCGLTIADNDFVNKEYELPYVAKVKDWLVRYFNGDNPRIEELDLIIEGTDFQKIVWQVLMSIPYGEVMSYKEITKRVKKLMGVEKMSCQAVGTAVGKNKIAVIIPCHRVVGSNEKLGGYSLGIDKKIKLLKLEGIDTDKLKNS